VVEADEMYQNAGEKGIEHPDPDDPPRRRANSRRGHGTFANDRPPVAGMVGRESGEIRLEVVASANLNELGEFVDVSCLSGTTVNTDEWSGYNRVGGPLGTPEYLGDRRRRGWSARGALQYDGGDLDGAAELPAAVPGGEQMVYRSVRGDVRVGP
jgi:hypothetical protein